MAVDLQWALRGVADETPLTTALKGALDTTQPSVLTGTVPKVDTATLVNGYPLVRFDQVAATQTFLELPWAAGATRTTGFVFRTPSAWPSAAWTYATVVSGTSPRSRIVMGGASAPGSARLTNAAGTELTRSSNNIMALSTTYYMELQHTAAGVAGLLRLRIWDATGLTLLYDSTPLTGDLGITCDGIQIGRQDTTPTVAAFWTGLVTGANTITTISGPLAAPTAPPPPVVTGLHVRGVITAPGVESPATLRGVITSPSVEAPALVREIWGGPVILPPPVTPGFTLVFDDQFATLDPAKYSVYNNSTYGSPTRIQRYMAANVVLATGVTGATNGTCLKLLSKRESVGGNAFTAGMMDTQSRSYWLPRYCRFEFRCKVPHGQGIWPSIWLTAHNDKGGANTAEVDVMEYFHGQVPGKNSITLHRTNNAGTFVKNSYTNNGSDGVWPTRALIEAPTYTPAWHKFAVEIVPVTDAGGLTTANPANPSNYVKMSFWQDDVKVFEFVDTSALWWTTNGGSEDSYWNIYTQGSQISGTWVGSPDDPLASNALTRQCLNGGTYPNCTITHNGYSVIRAGAPGSTATFSDPATSLTIDYYRVSKFTDL